MGLFRRGAAPIGANPAKANQFLSLHGALQGPFVLAPNYPAGAIVVAGLTEIASSGVLAHLNLMATSLLANGSPHNQLVFCGVTANNSREYTALLFKTVGGAPVITQVLGLGRIVVNTDPVKIVNDFTRPPFANWGNTAPANWDNRTSAGLSTQSSE
jgi:hypothetical protein